MSYNNGPKIVTDGLVLALDPGNIKSYLGSGTAWNDLSGNSNNGTLTNGPTFSSVNGGSIVFDGTNDYVDTSVKLFTGSSFSVNAWINVSVFTGSVCSGMMSNSLYSIFGTTSTYQGYSNTFSAAIQRTSTSNTVGTIMQSNFSTNTWYHYVAVYDGTQTGDSNRLKLWLNGIQYNLVYDTAVPSSAYNNNTVTRIGYTVGASYPYFNGKISNLTYYNRALSAAEIIQNYNAAKTRFGL